MNPEQVADILLDSQGRPREAARRVLEWLLNYLRARSVSLWTEAGGIPSLSLGTAVDQETMAFAASLWIDEAAAIAAGGPVVRGERILLPVRGGGAYLLLEGIDTRRADLDVSASMGAVVAKALARTDLRENEIRTVHSVKRDDLLAALALHEWNIARVARAKRVTRKTIYDWLARYQISRERVAKV
jgi:hypothetical protein